MMLFLLLLGAASFSQTASLATVTASPGQNIPVALNVTGFTGIGAITFNILFDPAVMTFTGLSSAPSGFIAGVTGNTINITGSWYPYTTFGPGKLFDLNFTYSGMTPSPLNFLGTCQVTQGVTVIHPTYTNGSVSMNTGLAQKANLVSATATTGGNVTVPLEYTALPAVGAITQKVHYDPTKLTFVNVQGIGSLAAGLNYSANAGSGIITITWTNIGGTGVNANANKFLLNFVYIGSTVTNVDFVSGCLISTAPSGTNVPVSYFGGIVSLGSASASAVLGSITGVHQGQDNLEVPLTLAGFPTTNVRAFTLTIPYDSPRLSFLGLKTPVSGLVISQASGTLTLAWTDASGVTNVNGIFLTLKFKYNGIGPASVRFGNGCVFNTYNAGVTGTVQVAYTNSIIVPALETATATIGYPLPVTAGNPVLVPINFSGLPLLNMGAATLKITYDYNKLTYIDIQNNTYGASVGHNATTHTITIAWASASAITLTGKFLDLRFMYNGGGGDCGAAVSFVDGCELASYAFPSPIVPANWING
ncbi:MAG: cohesin domain-containing protein, partial [bacterium]